MSLTRRSFIKKSSYSAAAVTAFGTGVGLAQNPSSQVNVWWYLYDISFANAMILHVQAPDGLTDAQATEAILQQYGGYFANNHSNLTQTKTAPGGTLVNPGPEYQYVTAPQIDANYGVQVTDIKNHPNSIYMIKLKPNNSFKLKVILRK